MSQFKPKIIAFCCNWCSYAGADLAGVSRIQYPAMVRDIRVMCSARVDPRLIFDAFLRGVDGMMVLGWHLGDCHYVSGNYHTLRRAPVIKKLLELAGVSPDRFRLEWCSSAEAQRFVDIVTEMTGKVAELGPLGSEGIKGKELEERLTAARDATRSERLRWLLGNEYLLETGPNVFGEKYDEESLQQLLDTCVRDEYLKSRILNMTREKSLSVKEMASVLEMDAGEVLRIVTILRGRNIVDVEEVRGTSPLYTALV